MTIHMQSANAEWSNRPADQRFAGKDTRSAMFTAGAFAKHKMSISKQVDCSTRDITFSAVDGDPIGGLQLVSKNGFAFKPSHWAFGQLAAVADMPAGYGRKLPAELTADCLNYGLMKKAPEDIKLLLRKNGEATVAACTGQGYGRIYDAEYFDALIGEVDLDTWTVPGEFGIKCEQITKENSTIYASDRDMFVFLADETRRIKVANRRDGKSGTLARGFYGWNSEVGSATVGAGAFLMDFACMNRTIWGGQDFSKIQFRHTSSAPARFVEQLIPVLKAMQNASVHPIEEAIRLAQAAKVDDVVKFLSNRRYGKAAVSGIIQAHTIEENHPIETLWDLSVAMTAFAKSIPFQDERIVIERDAGKVLDLVAVR